MKNIRIGFVLAVAVVLTLGLWVGARATGTVINLKYGTSNQAITCTITSLANSTSASTGYRGCAAIDNSTNVFIDYLVHLKVKTGTVSGTPVVNLYAALTSDGGTTYTDGATGTNAAQTAISATVTNWKLVGVCQAPSNTSTYDCDFSLAQAIGTVPDHFQLIVQNVTGAALDASVGSLWYQGVYAQTQ